MPNASDFSRWVHIAGEKVNLLQTEEIRPGMDSTHASSRGIG